MFNESKRLAGLAPEIELAHRAIVRSLVQGRIDDAERDITKVLALAPGHPEFLRLSGLVELARGRSEEAIICLLRARSLQPDDPLIHDALGSAYETIHDYSRARATLHSACRLDPGNAGFWFNYANRLYEGGDNTGSLNAVQQALRLDSKQTQARGLLATLTLAAGQHADARDQYRRIVDEDPVHAGMVWWWLATLKPMPLTDTDIALMQRIVDERTLAERVRAPIGFALAIALEHRGRAGEAFSMLQTAHEFVRANSPPYDVMQRSRHVDEILQAFDPVPVGAGCAQGNEAIFVVSMPRSGSTLTEQILASHSQVEGGGELPDFLQVVMDESERNGQLFPQWVQQLSTDQWRMLGQRYLARTRRFRTQRPRFTDKRLDNWMMVGPILAGLPDARVIIVRRDPLENCLACYRYMITHDYTHTFSDLATVWRDFDRAARRWQELYPGRVYVQVYEDLVADAETQIRKLLEFCDLPFEEACLNFHMTMRMVTTPSATQVREPIRRDTARAHKYGALLDPLRVELGLPPFKA